MKLLLTHYFWKKLFIPLAAIIILLIIGFFGFIIIEGYTPVESLYMIVITFTSIGFGEVHPLSETGRVFTIFLILSGFTVGVYSISKVTSFFIDGEFSKQLKIKKMDKTLGNLKDHFVVCGYGKTGKKVLEELLLKGYNVILIEDNLERVERLKDFFAPNLIKIVGDATHEEILQHAKIEKAKVLISVLNTDAENLFVTLTAKDLNKNIKVITRVEDINSTLKFKKAGADFIISPIDIATERILSIATTGSDLFSFVEFAEGREELQAYKFGLVQINSGSDLIGKTYRESNIPQRTHLIVMGSYTEGVNLQVNPKADDLIQLNDKLLVFGMEEQINQLKKIAK